MGGMNRRVFILRVSVPPPPFASSRCIQTCFFYTSTQPLNKRCACVKIKNRNNRSALITLIRLLCLISGELLRSFEMHEAGSFSRCLLSVLWPFKDPCCLMGSNLESLLFTSNAYCTVLLLNIYVPSSLNYFYVLKYVCVQMHVGNTRCTLSCRQSLVISVNHLDLFSAFSYLNRV